jgi:hypothetical protein
MQRVTRSLHASLDVEAAPEEIKHLRHERQSRGRTLLVKRREDLRRRAELYEVARSHPS